VFAISLVSLALSVFILIYFFNFKKRLKEIEYPFEVEERILELLGKFKHVASIKLEMLEKKVEELKQLTKEANDIYASLSVLITDINKLKDDLKDLPIEERKTQDELIETPKTDNKVKHSLSKSEKKEEKLVEESVKPIEDEMKTVESDESLERKILRLNEEGMSDLDIARKLGIGVGEVKLIVELFKGQKT